MLIASSGVLHFFKAPDTNSIYLTHRPDRADQNCPAFSIPRMTKYCNKYCNAGENVLLHRQKCVIEHRNKALTAKQSPGLFLPNAAHLEPRVASSNLANKQKRKQDILAAPPAEMSNRHRDIRHLLRNSPPDCFCQMLRIWSLVSQVQIL